jgi:Mg-chelatase subunit ChlD
MNNTEMNNSHTENKDIFPGVNNDVNETNPFLATIIKFAAAAAAAPDSTTGEESSLEEEEQQPVLFLGYSLTQLTPDEENQVAAVLEEKKVEQVHFQEKTFGILQLDVNVFQQIRNHLKLLFMQDISGSMADKCKDGRTKMEHTRFTLERILDYLVQNNIDVSVGLMGFDNVVEERIPLQPLNSSNLDSLTLELNKLKPRNGTNIGKALEQVIPHEHGVDRMFILLTDGQSNDGVTDKKSLKKKVDKILDEDTTVITVGCGVDHDAALLDYINPGNYYFVDDFEKSGLVCGEFLDKQLNTLLKQVVITVENGEIFSWRENEWVTKLSVTPIVAECNRTYHVRALNPAEFVLRINAVSTKDDLPFACEVNTKVLDQDLIKFKFRQETLETLNEVRIYNQSNVHEIRSGTNGKRIKKSLLELFKRMKDYMDKNNLRESECEDGKFMRVLCDDVVVAHRTFGTLALSTMYLTARQTSQGEQRTYNVSQEEEPSFKRNKQLVQEDDLPFRVPTMSRQYTIAVKRMEDEEEEDDLPPPPAFLKRMNNCYLPPAAFDDFSCNPSSVVNTSMASAYASPIRNTSAFAREDDDDDIMSQHKMSDCLATPYSNERQVSMMRGCSYQSPAPDKNEDDKEEEEEI